MRYFFQDKFTLIILFVFFLTVISGCVRIVEILPGPPGLFVKIELNGPYDGDIPSKFVKQLKSSSITSDWAIPYIFINVGKHFESVGDEVRAIYFYDRAITEFQRRKNVTGEATATTNKIFAFYEFGKVQEAFNSIKTVEKNWSQTPLNAFVLYNYGHYYLMTGDCPRALNYLRQSLKANANFGDDVNLLMLQRDAEIEYGSALIMTDYFSVMSRKIDLLNLDEQFYKAIRKNIDEGINHLKQVTLLNRKIRETKIDHFIPANFSSIKESNAYNFLGLFYGIKGQTPEALRNLDISFQLAEDADYLAGEIDNIFFRTHVYLLEGNTKDGQKSAGDLNEIAVKYHLPFYQIWAEFILSRYYLGAGDTAQATNILKNAISVMEKQPTGLVTDKIKETYKFDYTVLYDALIELLAKEGDYMDAFEVAERAKSRELIEQLTGIDIGKTPVETELIKQDSNFKNEMAEGYKKLLSATSRDNPTIEKSLDKINKAQEGHFNTITKIKGLNEELYSLLAVEPLYTDDLRKILDGNTTLFSYYITNKTTYIWAVNRDRVHLERINISKEEVAELVFSLNKAIITKDNKRTGVLSEKIYNTFLKPVIPYVSGDRIGFIPHRTLYYLPFAVMSYRGQYLVDGFSIFYLPSAGALKYIANKKPSKGLKVLAFGNPDLGDRKFDLPDAEAEVESIRKIIPQTKILLRAKATKNKAKEMLENYDIIHFAAQGLFVEDAPLNSGLLLAGKGQVDGTLTAGEIFKLQFKGRAVVMSACEAAPGLSSTGIEIPVFIRSFLYAGSPSVVATLWDAEDNSTAVFTGFFYKNIKKSENIADALNITQNEMIKLGYEPYHWAGFFVNGR